MLGNSSGKVSESRDGWQRDMLYCGLFSVFKLLFGLC